jgi:hypothetical protein
MAAQPYYNAKVWQDSQQSVWQIKTKDSARLILLGENRENREESSVLFVNSCKMN